MQISRLLLAIVFLGAACSSQPKSAAKDPHAPATEPAVVTMPLPPAPAPQASAASGATSIANDPRQREAALSQLYALSTAMMINQDTRSLAQLYIAGASLTLPDSVVRGAPTVALAWTGLAKSKSLEDFQRTSQGVKVLDDSTLADSGTYAMTMRRSPKDSVVERGRYATTIRVRATTDKWVMMTDHLMPSRARKDKR